MNILASEMEAGVVLTLARMGSEALHMLWEQE
ncbi:nucleoside phosphorylase [Pelolinea submarina]|nr:nucleoside phosphorylase [Pelolinea submarina]